MNVIKDIKQVSHWIRERRSIYPNMYSDEKIDRGIIEQLLENANWAPTHRLTEPWRFMVFTGEGLKKFADFQAQLYHDRYSGTENFDKGKYEKLKSKPLLSSHIIAVGMRRDPKKSVPELEEICATACAVQNMWLTASAMGLGCYWSTGGATYYEEAKPFFGLGPEDKLLGFLNLGWPKNSKWPQGKRTDIAEKVTWMQ